MQTRKLIGDLCADVRECPKTLPDVISTSALSNECERPYRAQRGEILVRLGKGGSYYRFGSILLQPNFHITAHIQQIRDALAAADQ